MAKDKLFNFVATVTLVFMNPLLQSVFWLLETLIFIVFVCLFFMGKISLRFWLLSIIVLNLFPILAQLSLLGFWRLLSKREGDTEIDKRSE